ncbi:MAG: helical backbone metal receptor [Pseudomonadota bacterium]
MRVFSHTCSNTEIVCALGCAHLLVGIDTDSDHPADLVATLPKLGRDLELDVAAVATLKPDLVLTSLTVPGHERIVEALGNAGLNTLVMDPRNLEDVYKNIGEIAEALDVSARGNKLVSAMRADMPPVTPVARTRILVEWWPKPVIAPARESWVTDLIHLAGGENITGGREGKSVEVPEPVAADVIVMSWCGVKEDKYRADVVARRGGWSDVPAVKHQRIYPITEAFLGRPGPRLVEGYKALRRLTSVAS